MDQDGQIKLQLENEPLLAVRNVSQANRAPTEAKNEEPSINLEERKKSVIYGTGVGTTHAKGSVLIKKVTKYPQKLRNPADQLWKQRKNALKIHHIGNYNKGNPKCHHR